MEVRKTPLGDGDGLGDQACVAVARNNAQSCSSVNQIPVIGQFVSQKNQASVCREMHCRGSGMCGEGRRTEGGSAAN